MIRVIISGASGRMSRRIISLIAREQGIEISAAIEQKNHKDIGKKLPDLTGIKSKNINCLITDDLNKAAAMSDVIIDFTTPKTTLENLKRALKFKKAIIIGTTGFSKSELYKIKKASLKIPVFFSPNMSQGVNVVFSLLKRLAKALPIDYNVEIIETHHKFKKDAPSGTAKRMAEVIALSRGHKPNMITIFGRKGHTGLRPKNEICIHAVRAGSITGKHEVKFISEEDEITITHNAFSRDIFARGAVQAAKFIYKKKKGLYGQGDLI